ncbi:MAG: hypothetical protein IJ168_09230 [Eubacterium sp.]|nr:hypothetical protein [Eubacterium sp.]
MSKKTKTVGAPEPTMYIGPTIAGLLPTSTIFQEGVLPDYVKSKIEECPSIQELILPISEVSKAKNELAAGKGAVSIFYRKVQQFIKK